MCDTRVMFQGANLGTALRPHRNIIFDFILKFYNIVPKKLMVELIIRLGFTPIEREMMIKFCLKQYCELIQSYLPKELFGHMNLGIIN